VVSVGFFCRRSRLPTSRSPISSTLFRSGCYARHPSEESYGRRRAARCAALDEATSCVMDKHRRQAVASPKAALSMGLERLLERLLRRGTRNRTTNPVARAKLDGEGATARPPARSCPRRLPARRPRWRDPIRGTRREMWHRPVLARTRPLAHKPDKGRPALRERRHTSGSAPPTNSPGDLFRALA
jgi:hypothetical protein